MDPEIVNAELVEPSRQPPASLAPYGVPRRFGIGTIMVVTAAFAGLLALLRSLGAPPIVVGILVAYVSLVGLGQAVLFRGRRPRLASIVTGAVCLVLLGVVAIAGKGIPLPGRGFSMSAMASLLCAVIWGVPFGAMCGYLAGGVVAGVFLVMDAVDTFLTKLFQRRRPHGDQEPDVPTAVDPGSSSGKN
ncbi:MAG TPA: hypothetical protein VMV69_02100 [Pirellulales bacterium]|nr:hypothetical protein [Pirellulales bacterium]